MRWHESHKTCSHANEDACPTCDFDGYYAANYPDCPWRIPDSLADEDGAVILNPTAVGNPDETPQVWVGADLRALLSPCACGGVNGFHAEECRIA
jgi:hypothetical protein